MKKIIISIASFLILASCTEKIDMETGTTFIRLAVSGQITTDTTAHKIWLKKTTNVEDTMPAPRVSGANLIITDDASHTFVLTESNTEPGLYLTDPTVFGLPGHTYTLHISNVDINGDGTMETYEASDKMNPVPPLDSIKLERIDDWEATAIKVWATDPATTEFYLFKYYVNDTLLTDTITEVFLTDDILFNGNTTNGIRSQYLEDEYDDEILNPGDVVTFEINSVSEEYFTYLYKLQTEVFPKVPLFSGPPANVSTNVKNIGSNGPPAVGFFSAYSLERSSVVYDPATIIVKN